MRFILLFSFIVFAGCQLKQDKLMEKRVEIKCEFGGQNFCDRNLINIKASIINNTDSIQEFILPICGFSECFVCRNSNYEFQREDCYSNLFAKITLKPKQYTNRFLTLKIDSSFSYIRDSIRIGFHFIRPMRNPQQYHGWVKNDENYEAVENYMRALPDRFPLWSNWIHLKDFDQRIYDE